MEEDGIEEEKNDSLGLSISGQLNLMLSLTASDGNENPHSTHLLPTHP